MLVYYFPPTADAEAPRLTPPPSPTSLSSSSSSSHTHTHHHPSPPTRPLPPPPASRDRKSRILARLSHLPSTRRLRPQAVRAASMPPAPAVARHSRQRSSSTTDAQQQPQPQQPQQPPAIPAVPVPPASPAREIGNAFSYLRSRRGQAAAQAPTPPNPPPPAGQSQSATTASPASPPHSPNPAAAPSSSVPHVHLPHISLHRRHSTTAPVHPSNAAASASVPAMQLSATPTSGSANTTASAPAASSASGPQPHRLRLVPHLETARSLIFDPILRQLPEGGAPIRIGRFTERRVAQGERGDEGKIAFRSKVVSRAHAEVWCEMGGKVLLKDTASSSGTFLNHIRLSSPNVESRPFPLKDGDVIQLGVDYQGGTEEIYRCVKIRVELDRFVGGREAFNTHALAQINALAGAVPVPDDVAADPAAPAAASEALGMKKASITECSICISSVTVCQALFIAPCSHVFHYKCIRPLVEKRYPGFMCPMCRCYADLDADVDDDADEVALKATGAPKAPVVQPAPQVVVDVDPPAPAPVPAPAAPQPAAQPASRQVDDEDQDMDEAAVVSAALHGGAAEEDDDDDEDGIANVSDDEASSGPALRPMDEDEDALDEQEVGAVVSPVPIPASSTRIAIAGPSRSHPPQQHQAEGLGFDNATPMNHLFLSTLADMPARRSQLVGAGFGGLSPIPSVASMAGSFAGGQQEGAANGNGHAPIIPAAAAAAAGGAGGKGKGKRRAPVVNITEDDDAEEGEEDDGAETTGEDLPVRRRTRAQLQVGGGGGIERDRDGDSLMEGERGPKRPLLKKRKTRA